MISMLNRSTIVVLIFLFLVTPFSFLQAETEEDKYVRTANYYLLSGTSLETSEALNELPQYDLLVLPAEAQVWNQDFFAHARSINPDIVILAYVPTSHWNDIWTDSLHNELYSGIQSSYWLRDGSGNQISTWPGTRAMNIASGWNTYLADFVHEEIMSTGLWDGIFYDDVNSSISWLGSVDTDNNGSNDSASTADNNWRSGYTTMFSRTRSLEGSNTIIITNGSSYSGFQPYVNGRMFESFPTPWEGDGSWQTVMQNYLGLHDDVDDPPIFIINSNTGNTGYSTDYQAVRYGLTSTLLGGGYFGFDYGTESHAQIWQYDEYEAYLGEPVEDPEDVLNPSNTTISPSVWGRDFAEGKVLVNSTSSTQIVNLGGEYEKLHGSQDPSVNNGAIVSQVSIPSEDGLILLRPIEELYDATYPNGSFVRIFNRYGTSTRTGFFSYDGRFSGGERVVTIDIDHDGVRETVVADESRLYVYESNGALVASTYPYGPHYDQGINFTVADIESDGTMEIITGTENGGGPHVRVFNKDAVLINPGFFAYAENFRGGVDVAVGDLNGDGLMEIITGAGYSGGPHVRVFSKDGNLVNPGFFAYSPSFRGGVNVASADVNGDGIDDVITGAGRGGGPHVRVFDKDGNMGAQWFAFDATGNTGVEVAAADLDGDGLAEIIGQSAEVFTFAFLNL